MKQVFLLLLIIISLTSGVAETKKDVMYYFGLITKPQLENREDLIEIRKKEIKNGYLEYTYKGTQGNNEFTIWVKKNGEVIAANASYGCGPVCVFDSIKFYEFKDGSPVDATSKYYPEEKLRELYKKRLSRIQAKGSPEDETYWLKIPQKGTTIEISIRINQMSPKETFIPIADLKFKNDSFELVERK